eukprot:scaffold1487_cov116-Isochrysis_galbana.AAC.27
MKCRLTCRRAVPSAHHDPPPEEARVDETSTVGRCTDWPGHNTIGIHQTCRSRRPWASADRLGLQSLMPQTGPGGVTGWNRAVPWSPTPAN